MGATDPEVAKRNAQAEERIKNLTLPALRPESTKALDDNLKRTEGRYDLIKTVATRHGVDPDELYAKYVIETRGSANPESPGTSGAGASGPFQLMPNTRKAFEQADITDPFERDADAAARLMADIQQRNDLSPDALSVAYNLGEGSLRKYGGDATSSLPGETTNYLAYSRYLRPTLRKQTMDTELAQAASAVPAPKYRDTGFLEDTGRVIARTVAGYKSSETDDAIADYDRKVAAAKAAKQAELDQRYKETR
jgi:hypothetical protein